MGQGVRGGIRNEDGIWLPVETDLRWFLWVPPPALADVALEELTKSRHKRSRLNHIIIVPRLMTHLWRKRMYKVCDLVFEIPPGARSFWPVAEHEPLIIGLTLRFISCRPWQLKNHDRVVKLGRELHQVWKEEKGNERIILRQLCNLPPVLEGMPSSVVQ